MKIVAENRCFGGRQLRFEHISKSLDCAMHLSVYLPPQASHGRVPAIYWLSGLTCTDQNFVQKAGAQRAAAQLGLALIAPDTSPRGDQVPGDPEGHWSFGHGAGYYLDATESPWSRHYQMHQYIRYELPELLETHTPINDQRAIMGHSMGGHGALCLGLKHPHFYSSISAFAPICQPTQTPWGKTAFSRFLGPDKQNWKAYDATALLQSASAVPAIKIDQGAEDEFLDEQLKPDALLSVAKQKNLPIDYQLHPGYDHSYFFIASFIDDHIAFHAEQFAE